MLDNEDENIDAVYDLLDAYQFRIILLRAMAWTINESFDPFKPLVTLHLER